jgi:hypothetical protein
MKNGFFRSVALILFITSSAKLYSAFGSERILDRMDRLLQIPNRWVLVGTGLIELAIVLYLLFGRIERTKLLAVLWLGSGFILYRFFHWFFGYSEPCRCLGKLGERLPLSSGTLDFILMGAVLYLFAGSLAFLVSSWRRSLPAKFVPAEEKL